VSIEVGQKENGRRCHCWWCADTRRNFGGFLKSVRAYDLREDSIFIKLKEIRFSFSEKDIDKFLKELRYKAQKAKKSINEREFEMMI
jgi:hypothetical protein